MTGVVEARGAKLVISDCGRYSNDPIYVAQGEKLAKGLDQAVTWYEEGLLRPQVTHVVPFDAVELQKAFEEFLSGKNNVGKVLVRGGSR